MKKDEKWGRRVQNVGRGGCIFERLQNKLIDSTEFLNFVHTKLGSRLLIAGRLQFVSCPADDTYSSFLDPGQDRRYRSVPWRFDFRMPGSI